MGWSSFGFGVAVGLLVAGPLALLALALCVAAARSERERIERAATENDAWARGMERRMRASDGQ